MSEVTRTNRRGGSSGAADDDSSPVADFKAEMERTKGTLDEVKAEVAAATDERRGGPADSVEDATTKAADLRHAIERDVAALRARVPEKETITDTARTVGVAVGGGILVLFGLLALWKRRGARRERERGVHEQAAAIARELVRIERVESGEDASDDEGGRWRWAMLGTLIAGAGTLAWQRSRTSMEAEDVFGSPQDDPLRPDDVTP